MSQLSLTEGNVRRALSRFAIPFLGASLLQFLYGAVDLIVVGQFADQAGIAAVSTGSQVMQAVTNFIIGLSTGGTVLVGQYLGARRGEDVNRAIGTLFSLFALIAVVLAAAFALSTNAIVALMQVPAAAVAPARQYLFICACGLVFITGYNMVSGVLRGLGDSKRPMYFVLVACIINIVGDLLLVGVFGLGAAGAALATVAAQGVSLALALAVLRRRDFPFDFKRRSFRIQGDKAARILRLGLPVAVQNVLVTLSFLIITAIVNHMDVLAQSAAVGLVERITGFIMLFPIAFQSAISAMTAQNMGAGRPDRARQGLKYGILFCLAADIAMFVLVQLVPGLAMRLFTPDAEVIYHGVLYLAPTASTAFWSPLCSPSTVFTAAAAAPASPCSTVWHPPSWYGYRRYFSSACSPVSLCCTSVWPRRRPPPSRCSSSSSTSAPAGGTTRFWGRRRHDRRSAGLPGRRSGPHFPL